MKLDALHWIQVVLVALAWAASTMSQVAPQFAYVCVPIASAAIGMLGTLGLVTRSILPAANAAPIGVTSSVGVTRSGVTVYGVEPIVPLPGPLSSSAPGNPKVTT